MKIIMFCKSCISFVAAQRKKLSHLHKIATAQSIDYMNSLDKANIAERELLKVDPALRNIRHRATLQQLPRRPPASIKQVVQSEDRVLDGILKPKYRGKLAEFFLPGFGGISVEHGDIFKSKCDALVLPLPPNLHAAKGISLRFIEKAGRDFARHFFRTAQEICGEPTRNGVPVGTVIPVQGAGGVGNFKRIYFAVMPSYWQGNSTDAHRRFRFVLQQIFRSVHADSHQTTSLALSHLGRGMFGFDQDWTWRTFAEELVDSAMLQIDNSRPLGNLFRVNFVEEDCQAADSIRNALEEYLDERSSLMAAHTAPDPTPMVVLHTMGELNKAKRVDRVKFRKYSGIIRNLRLHYKRFIRPHVWRSSVMNPLSDKVGVFQPHFYRGVTHTLFPSRSNFSFAGNLKRSASGRLSPRFVSVPRRIQEQSNPRL